MKILGLDIGAAWIGTALSDVVGITCRPYKTVHIDDLIPFLEELLHAEHVDTVVVGHPVTVGGGRSQQTEEIEKNFEKLRERFSQVDERSVEWVLWDERFSTKRAQTLMQEGKRRIDKEKKEHSIAAAFILQSYIDSKALERS
jgi:putative Holliday junction resolvase